MQSPWVSADIGTVGTAGSADETSGTFTIDGAGADIGGTADSFHYVYQSLAGDGEIIANVASLTGGGSTPKAGLMIRDSLSDDAIQVSALVRGNRIRVYERTTTGGSTSELNGSNGGAPEWLRVERTGNTFDLYHSNNGTSWLLMQTRTVAMGTNVFIGTAVTSNSTTTLATGTFDNVTVTGGGGPTATPTNTPTATSSNNGLFYFYNDHLGSTTALVNSSGSLVAQVKAIISGNEADLTNGAVYFAHGNYEWAISSRAGIQRQAEIDGLSDHLSVTIINGNSSYMVLNNIYAPPSVTTRLQVAIALLTPLVSVRFTWRSKINEKETNL